MISLSLVNSTFRNFLGVCLHREKKSQYEFFYAATTQKKTSLKLPMWWYRSIINTYTHTRTSIASSYIFEIASYFLISFDCFIFIAVVFLQWWKLWILFPHIKMLQFRKWISRSYHIFIFVDVNWNFFTKKYVDRCLEATISN